MHRTATIILILLFILLNAGCTGVYSGDKTPASGTPEKIVVQAPLAPPTAPLFKMAGEVLPDGTPLEIIFYKSVEEATTRVVKGEADFSVLPVNVAAKLYNKGVDISLANVSTWGILYLVSLESDVREWTDLRGEELYVGARDSTPDVLTQYFLSRSGLKDGEAHLNYLDSPEIARMMINGLVKNAVLPEPMLTQVLMNHKEARVIRDFYSDWQQYEGDSTALPQAGMVVLNQFARNYPGTISEFHRAF
jgi:NitT/TauT family transport system substrate-binding protein